MCVCTRLDSTIIIRPSGEAKKGVHKSELRRGTYPRTLSLGSGEGRVSVEVLNRSDPVDV